MPGVLDSASSSGRGERLAGVAAVEDVDGSGSRVDVSDVSDDGDVGEVPLEHSDGVGVVLAEEGWFGSEGGFDAEVESSDSRKDTPSAHTALIFIRRRGWS